MGNGARWLACLGVAAALAAQPASGQGNKGQPKGGAAQGGPLIQKLRSKDPAQIKSALDDARIAGAGAASAAPVIAELLHQGLSYDLTIGAIETLADIEAPTGSAAVAQYASHRDVKIRRAALKALVRVKGPAAAPAMRAALSDSDAGVRATAATGLGGLKAKDAVADLFTALDHKVVEAAASIGQLCNNEQCVALSEKLGKLPFDVVTTGLEPTLFRPTQEVSDDTKIKVVGRIRELGTQEANKFLRDVQGKWPKNGSARVRTALDQAVLATSGGTK